MPDWRDITRQLRERSAKVPKIIWAAIGVIAVSLAVVTWLESGGPPYAVLSEGLTPAAGGKVIAQLQKLGIPYELQAAGNIILVPAPQLAQARLQLGAAQIPGTSAQAAWTRLENAPMTTSDLAQSTMATQALELSLAQSIEAMNAVRRAQVFLALPPETPFLGDQPHPSASVVLDADPTQAAAQAKSIAALVAGAVPGLKEADVTVVTTSGITVYPVSGAMNTGRQFATIEQVETDAAARVAGLLLPIVGAGNFRTDVSANVDFTQIHINQISYGPVHLVQHSHRTQNTQIGSDNAAIGIPGALSNEPPTPTTTSPAAKSTSSPTDNTRSPADNTTAKPPNTLPRQTSSSLDQSFVTDQTDSNIVKPNWSVKSIAISVVINQSAVPKDVTIAEIQHSIAAGFAYPDVKVNVLATPFNYQVTASGHDHLAMVASPLTHALLELLAALALLFGLALPVGRRLAGLNLKSLLPPPAPEPVQHTLPQIKPRLEFNEICEQAMKNIPDVASLLQGWTNEHE